MKTFIYSILIFIGALSIAACATDILPKPKGGLRLDYPQAAYSSVTDLPNCPFTFEANTLSAIEHKANSCNVNINYPAMKATIYLTYKNVDGNIRKLLTDAQNFTYKHTVKADNIAATTFVNDTTKVYGMFYQVYGNAASQSQFYATDSVKHFISGSIYFNVEPNYDSVQPASDYLQRDMRRIMETLRWK
jgi:gliding motility-associated lipoprotein gldD|nr:gliding motility lipoprotein GldD [uncultured Capnocytophaga sp.]